MSDLRVNIRGDATSYKQTLDQVRTQTKAFTDSVGKGIQSSWGGIGAAFAGGLAGAFSLSAVTGLFERIFERAKSVKELSEQFDLSTDSVQQWEKALDRAGISANTFYRALDTLRSKREEAQKGGKNDFTGLGLGAQALNSNVSDEELLRMVLNSSGSRPDINTVLGPRGARLKGATGYLGTEPELSAQDIEDTHAIWNFVKSQWGHLNKLAVDMTRNASLMIQHPWMTISDPDSLWAMQNAWKLDAAKRQAQEMKENNPHVNIGTMATNRGEVEAGRAGRELWDAEARLRESERAGMLSPASRRTAIAEEIKTVKAEMKNEGLDAEEWTLDSKERMRRLEMLTRIQGLNNELFSNDRSFFGGINWNADSMSKVGLYSASTVAFSPVVSINQEMLRQLIEINHKIAESPFAP